MNALLQYWNKQGQFSSIAVKNPTWHSALRSRLSNFSQEEERHAYGARIR